MENVESAKAKVLVVDDEGDLSELLQEGLAEDYIVETVFDADQALSVLGSFRPDLLVTDLYSSTQSGFNFLEEIQKLVALPVIVISSSEWTGKKSHLKSQGVTTILIKPFTLRELKEHIQRALSR